MGRGRAGDEEPKEEAERLAERKFKKYVSLRVVPEETPYKNLIASNRRSKYDSNMIERLNKPHPFFCNSIATLFALPSPSARSPSASPSASHPFQLRK